MCLILLAWKSHPRFPLVVAANRDEFFARPTASAWFWRDASDIFAGRDLQAGGTWLGVTRRGRFAALTNFRDPQLLRADKRSRGELVAEFLREDIAPADYARRVALRGADYNGFNLLVADAEELHYASNVDAAPRRLEPGVYGLSNHLLDTAWPKVARGRSALADTLVAIPDTEPLFALLRDDSIAPDDQLPRTGVSLEWERLLSAAFVRSSDYGTRNSTVVLFGSNGSVQFEERSFGPGGVATGSVRGRFRIEPPARGTS